MELKGYKPRVYWEQRLSKDFSLQGVGCYPLGEAYNRWLYKRRSFKLFKELARFKLNWEQIKILEVAPEVGYYTNIFKNLGVKNLTGIDIAKVAVKNLQKKFPDYKFIQADISEIQLQENFYNLITVIDVIFHIVSDELFFKVLENLKKSLAPAGIIVITDRFPPKDLNWAEHVRLRSFATYQEVLNSAEFSRIEVKPLVYLMSEQVGNEHRLAGKRLKQFWNLISQFAPRNNFTANFIGGGLYALERVLDIINLKTSFAEKVLIAQKRSIK